MSAPLYAIVEFTEYESVSVIPVKWFVDKDERECYWPKKTWPVARRNKAIEERLDANKSFTKYKVRSLGKAGERYSLSIMHYVDSSWL